MRLTTKPRGMGDIRALLIFLGILAAWYAVLTLFGAASRPGSYPAEPRAAEFRAAELRAAEFRAAELRAARQMKAALKALSEDAQARGETPEPRTDPNRSGIIGLEWSPITTTLGSLPAKRSAAQPDAAALMARLFVEAGIKPGDLVAVESSGSFPGFAIASLVAAGSLGATATASLSIGSSTWGANRPGFTLPDMVLALERRGILADLPISVSPGGSDDIGRDMEKAALEAAMSRAEASGARIIREADLGRDVAARKAFLESRGKPRIFVSIGGNWAAAGPGEALLGRTGLLCLKDFPGGRVSGHGLVQSFLRDGLPVIRILDVEDLCARTGLAYDPRPWPGEGKSGLYRGKAASPLVILAGPILAIAAVLALRLRRIVLPKKRV